MPETPETVVWFSPEEIRQERIDSALAEGASAEEIADIAKSPALGQYREYHGEEVVNNVVEAKLGGLVQWVHLPDAGGEFVDGEGEYVVYEAAEEDYVPVVTQEGDLSNG